MPYLRRVYRLPAELEERVVADLWQSGTLGVATESEPDGRLRLTAWFEAGTPGPARHPGAETLPGDPPSPVECVSEDEQPDVDWMAEYRRQAGPFPLGRLRWLDPPEPEPAA